MKACILVRVEPRTEIGVAAHLESMDPIQDAFPVLGQPEVVVRVDASRLESLAGLVAEISETDGVLVSETLLEIPGEAVT